MNIQQTITKIKQNEESRLKIRKQIELMNTVGINFGKGRGRGKGNKTAGRGRGKSEGMGTESGRGTRGGRGGRGSARGRGHVTPPHITSIVHKASNTIIYTDGQTEEQRQTVETDRPTKTPGTDKRRPTERPTETSKPTHDTDEHRQTEQPTETSSKTPDTDRQMTQTHNQPHTHITQSSFSQSSSQSSQRSKLSLKFNKAQKSKPTTCTVPTPSTTPISTFTSTFTSAPTRISTQPNLPYNKRKQTDTIHTPPQKKIKTDINNSQTLSAIDKIIKTVNIHMSPSQELDQAVTNLKLEMEKMKKAQQ